MRELENPEERKDPEKSAGWPLTKEWTKIWKRLEELTRQHPAPHLLVALVAGWRSGQESRRAGNKET
jgi:hypothetical protein